jgi:sulfane dehydrogenase subunit SoxC
MPDDQLQPAPASVAGGRLRKAPENFLDPAGVRAVFAEGKRGRRDFIRGAFAAALAGGAAARAGAQPEAPVGEGDPAILNLPAHSTGLGQAVATDGYGRPSKYEGNVQRRPSPGLTQTSQSSVSFAPLQSLFGIVTPSGLHFERHHQGWWDIDPAQAPPHGQRHGQDAPRLHHGRADAPAQRVALSLHRMRRQHRHGVGQRGRADLQYSHGMLSCSEFTGVPLITLLEMAGADLKGGKFVLAEGADGSSMTRTIPWSWSPMARCWSPTARTAKCCAPKTATRCAWWCPACRASAGSSTCAASRWAMQPWGAKDEAIHYIDLHARRHAPPVQQHPGVQERHHHPVGRPGTAGQGLLQHQRPGLVGARQGQARGRLHRGGRNWRTARLETPVLDKCLTRFNLDWVWDGKPAIVQSRAMDDTGYVQPSIRQLRDVRGNRSIYHNNAIQSWLVQENGEVKNVQVS